MDFSALRDSGESLANKRLDPRYFVKACDRWIWASVPSRVLARLAGGAARCQNPRMRLRAALGAAPWPPAMYRVGPRLQTAAHRHHSVQLLMTLRGSLRVRSGREKAWRKCGAVWVRPDATHEVDARGSTLLIGFFSAESDMGAALSELIDGEIACVAAHQVARWRAVLGPDTERGARRTLADQIPPAPDA